MDPFAFIPVERRSQILCIAALASLTFLFTFYRLGPANLAKALEASTDQEHLNQIVSSFGLNGWRSSLLNLGIDFFFIPTYIVGLGLACLAFLTHDVSGLFRNIGMVAATFTYVAGAADLVENITLSTMLLWRFDPLIVSFARMATIFKLVSLAIAVGFILVAVIRIALNLEPPH